MSVASRHSSTMKLILVLSIVLTKILTTSSSQGTPIRLSNTDIQEIVDVHNVFRGMVDPPASNMQPVEWNNELAGVAQAYAEMCVFRDNPNRTEQAPSFSTVGENLSASNALTPNYTEFVERGWFLQRVNYNYNTNMCSSPGSCTDYVQLVWAETTQIGCGVARCPTITGFGIPDSVILVCNYAPEGNIEDGRPYESGEPCSRCQNGQEFCITNVCSAVPPPMPVTLATTAAPTAAVTTTDTNIVAITTTLTQSSTLPTSPTTTDQEEEGEEEGEEEEETPNSRSRITSRASRRSQSTSRASRHSQSTSRESSWSTSRSRTSNSSRSSHSSRSSRRSSRRQTKHKTKKKRHSGSKKEKRKRKSKKKGSKKRTK